MTKFSVDSWLVDPQSRTLLRGRDTRRVSVKAMQVLVTLAKRPDGVVSRADLMDAVWPGVTVGEEVLTHAIAELRRSLDDDFRAPQHIQTVYKSGYRLLCPVKWARSSDAAALDGTGRHEPNAHGPPSIAPLPFRHSLIAVPGADGGNAGRDLQSSADAGHSLLEGLPSGEATVAVFPFAAGNQDPLRAEIALAVFETLNARLTAWRWFKVVSSDLWLAYSGAADPIRTARELGVRYVVTGSVRARQGAIRLAIQLVDGLSGYQLWAGIYDQPIDKLPTLEDKIASRVVAAIELELQKAERVRAIRKNGDQLDVYDLTQRGYWHYSKRTKKHNDQALQHFGAAVDRDPFYVPALTGQAACHFWAGQRSWTEDAGVSLRQGLSKAQDAVALDDQYPTAQLFLAQSLLFLGRHEAAVATVRRALLLNPCYAGAWAFLGHALTALGRFDGSVHAMKRAFQLTSHDTRRFIWLSNLALAHFHLGDHRSAAREAGEAVALQPDHWLANQVLMMALAAMGRGSDTEPLVRMVRATEPTVRLYDFANRMPYRNPSDLSNVVNALRRSRWTD